MAALHKITYMTANQTFPTTTLATATDLSFSFGLSDTGFYGVIGTFFVSSVTGFGINIIDASNVGVYSVYSGSDGRNTFLSSATAFATPSNPDIHSYSFRGFINVTTSANMEFQFRQASSNATVVTLHESSFVHFYELA